MNRLLSHTRPPTPLKPRWPKLAIGLCLTVSAQADFKALDDHTMSKVTGQSGLTLELDLQLNIREIAYRDEGYLSLKDVAWGGADRTGHTGVTGRFENWKMVIDIVDGATPMSYGFSDLDHYYNLVDAPDAAWAAAIANNDEAQFHGDGDLVIHNTSVELFDGSVYDRETDSDRALAGGPTHLPGNAFADAIDDWRNSAPFGVRIGAVTLNNARYAVGSNPADGTTLISNFNAEVLTGPLDIIIQNRGNGSTQGVPDSKMMISDYFEISDLSVNIDLFAMSISGFRFHNRRGDTTGLNYHRGADGILGTPDDRATESFGFGHMKWYLGSVSGSALQIGGAIKGDIDIDAIALSDDGVSIGNVEITDLKIEYSMNVRGH